METSTLMAFLKKASEDEGLRKELVSLAGRYGIQIGADELSDAALDQVSGGLLPAFGARLQTTLLSPGITIMDKQSPIADKQSPLGSLAYKLGDGSV